MIHLVAGLLFFLLSPGVLLTIPARSRGLLASGQTSLLAAAVHAALFVAVIYLLSNVVEGFAEDPCTPVWCTAHMKPCSNGCDINGTVHTGTCLGAKGDNILCYDPSPLPPGNSYYSSTGEYKQAQAAAAPATKAPAPAAPATKAPAAPAPATKAPATKAPATKAPAIKAPATKPSILSKFLSRFSSAPPLKYTGNDTTDSDMCASNLKALKDMGVIDLLGRMKATNCCNYAIKNGVTGTCP